VSPAPLADPSVADALFVAFVVAPGVYTRNRYFDLFENAGTKRAQKRAQALLTALRHVGRLGKTPGEDLGITWEIVHAVAPLATPPSGNSRVGDAREAAARPFRLQYAARDLGLRRELYLGPLDVAVFRVVATSLGVPGAAPSAAERALVDRALAMLAPVSVVPGGRARGPTRPSPVESE